VRAMAPTQEGSVRAMAPTREGSARGMMPPGDARQFGHGQNGFVPAAEPTPLGFAPAATDDAAHEFAATEPARDPAHGFPGDAAHGFAATEPARGPTGGPPDAPGSGYRTDDRWGDPGRGLPRDAAPAFAPGAIGRDAAHGFAPGADAAHGFAPGADAAHGFAPGADAHGFAPGTDGAGLVLPLHSRREAPLDRGHVTPLIPAIDRPELQPILRPLSSLRPAAAPPGSLGHYAPPRSAERAALARSHRRLFFAVVGVSAAAVIAALAIGFARRNGDEPPPVAKVSRPAAAPAPAPPPVEPAPPPPSGPCPGDDMALVKGDLLDGARAPFCLDRHEWPGAGNTPRLGASPAEAAAACAERAARLCSPAEWEAGCRGAGRASFPYGARYTDKKCNLRGGAIAAAGSFPECQSAAGAFDMSGNAAEWDSAGSVRGASATDGTRGRCSELRRHGRQGARTEDRSDVGFRCCADPLAKVTPSR
jgi:hypothetical protein